MLVACVAGTGVIRIARCIHRVLRSATALDVAAVESVRDAKDRRRVA